MAGNASKDMTQGSPIRLIIAFFIPLMLGMLFQQFYSMMDTIIVGRFLGVHALAAVGSTNSINFMIIGFCMGVCNGFAIPVAQQFGAKDYKTLRAYVANGIFLTAVFALVMTIVVCLLCRNILQWMNTPDDIIDGAYNYIFIIFVGIPVIYLYNILSGFIRSLGDSKSPLVFLIISSLLNIVLDLVLILNFDLGVAGAAWATVISQGISGAFCLCYIRKKYEILQLAKDEWKINKNCIKVLCNMGIPMGLQYSITAIGSVILQKAVNTLGSTAVASVTAANKVGTFFCCPFDAMGSTMSTYAGQNLGARKLERVTKGVLSCCLIGFVYSIAAFGILFFFGTQMALLFIDANEVAILDNVRLYLLVGSAFYFPLALVNIMRFTIQGLGYGKLAIVAGVCEMFARAIVGAFLVPVAGYIGACFASPSAWVFADLFLIPAYVSIMKSLRRRKCNIETET